MASGRRSDALRHLTQGHPSLEAFFKAYKEIHFGSDRAAAILVAAGLEQYLRTMILLHLSSRDTGTSGAPGEPSVTFSKNIRRAYEIGLIDKVIRDDLNAIKNIRNAFAHAMGHVSFSMPEIQQECARLKTKAVYQRPMLDTDQLTPPERQRYIAVASDISLKLLEKAAEAFDEEEPTLAPADPRTEQDRSG